MSDSSPAVKPVCEPQNYVKSQLYSCLYKYDQLVFPYRNPKLASFIVDCRDGKD